MKIFSFHIVGWLLVLALAPATAFATELRYGPYLQQPGPNGVTVVFELDGATEAIVRYGSMPDQLDDSVSSPQASRHVVRLDGLETSSTYHYAVEIGGQIKAGPHWFRTAPMAGEHFTFVLFGDTRSGHEAHALACELIGEEDFDFYLNTGDLVASGDEIDLWTNFFEIERNLMAHHPFLPTVGNHDEEDGHANHFSRFFVTGGPEGGEGLYYSVTYANVHVVVLDEFVNVRAQYLCPETVFLSDCLDSAQLEWMRNDLSQARNNPDIDFVFVAVHSGPYSSKEGRSGYAQIRQMLSEFQEYGVDMILSGHDHYYERGFGNNGLAYMVSGGGGASLYDCDANNTLLYPHEWEYREKTYHYALFHVNGPTLEIEVKNLLGEVIDHTILRAALDCREAADCFSRPSGSCTDGVIGEWACRLGECIWECPGALECELDEDCQSRTIPQDCEEGSTWRCLPSGSCDLYCVIEPECVTDADCAAMAPPFGQECSGGYYSCYDGACDWDCPLLPETESDGDEEEAPAEPVCEPDETRCVGDSIEYCTEEGQWKFRGDCGEVGCKDGHCITPDEPSPDGDDETPSVPGQTQDPNQAFGGGSDCRSAGHTSMVVVLVFIAILVLIRRVRPVLSLRR